MTRLTTKERKRTPRGDLALPGKRSTSGGKGGYPIEDKAHARNALARISQFGTTAEKAEVRRKVHEKYPSIGERNPAKRGTEKKSGERGRGRRPEGRGRERER